MSEELKSDNVQMEWRTKIMKHEYWEKKLKAVDMELEYWEKMLSPTVIIAAPNSSKPTPQKSPWIKIEPGCRLPGNGEPVIFRASNNTDNNFKSMLFCEYRDESFISSQLNTNISVEKVINDKRCDYYYMPIPPLPGGEE